MWRSVLVDPTANKHRFAHRWENNPGNESHRRDELAPSIAVRTDVKDSGARRWGTRTLPMMESCPLTEQIATSLA